MLLFTFLFLPIETLSYEDDLTTLVPENCQIYNSTLQICEKCYPGYYLESEDKNSSNCFSCVFNCDECENSIECIKCAKGYGLSKDRHKKCFKCTENCGECYNDYTICDQCIPGYGISIINGMVTCEKCKEGCDVCSTKDSCVNCSKGYFKSSLTGECEKCPDNCDYCERTDFCQVCSPFYGPLLNANNVKSGICRPCHSNCLRCDDNAQICSKCFDGYGPTIINGKKSGYCSKCPFGCKLCDDRATHCDVCFDNYTKVLDTGLCQKCPENAQECIITSDKKFNITKCNPGYGILSDKDGDISKNQCVKCSEHCLNCQNDSSICLQCEDGYYLNEQDSCSKCSEGCLLCSNYTKCELCDDGYGFDKEGLCSKCKSTCAKCSQNSGFCDECIEGYGPLLDTSHNSTGECFKCTDSSCQSCSTNYNLCLVCKEGYGPELDDSSISLGRCKKCPDNCMDCSMNFEECKTCQLGFGPFYDYYTGQTIQCAPCPENCDYCIDSNSTCSYCGDGSGFDISKRCELCSEHCVSCSIDSKRCLRCEDGYGLLIDENDANIQNCTKCPSNCANCTYSSYCDICAEGYGLNSEIGSCFKCGNNCLSCSDNKCDICRDGYGVLFDEDGPTTDCKQCPSNCLDCHSDSAKCELCEFGYGLDYSEEETSIKCSKCPTGCSQCFRKDTCKYCEDGYAYIETDHVEIIGRCEKCSDHCKACVSKDNCTQCEIGYYSPDGLCYECPKNCELCNYETGVCEVCDQGFSHKVLKDGSIVQNECVACPKNCKVCAVNNAECDLCMDGYGFKLSNETNSTNCFPCSDPNCEACKFDIDHCTRCIDKFFIDPIPYSPFYNKCVSQDQTCEAPDCTRCLYQSPQDCIQCADGFQLGRNFKCQNITLRQITPDSVEPYYIEDSNLIKESVMSFDVEDYDISNSSRIVTFKIDDSEIDTISITNWAKGASIALEIYKCQTELTIKVKMGNPLKVYIKSYYNKNIKYFFNEKINPIFIYEQSRFDVVCLTCPNNIVNVDKIIPEVEKLDINSQMMVVVNNMEFYSNSNLMFTEGAYSYHPKVNKVKINQRVTAIINNFAISERLMLGYGSSVNIGDEINLSEATIELPYDPSMAQLFTDKAFLTGAFSHHPKEIIIKEVKRNTPLAAETYLIAESLQEFDCDSWIKTIKLEANCSLNEFYCAEEYSTATLPVYRLYGASKSPDDSKTNSKLGTKTIIIIGAVAGGVVVIIIVVVVCVIKKKKENRESSDIEIKEEEYNDHY